MTQAQKPGRVRITFVAAHSPLDKDEDPLVRAANARPGWILKLSDSAGADVGSYLVWHPMDLASGDTVKVMSIEAETRGADGAAYMQRIREQIQQIVPDLPDEVFERLTSRQLLAIGMKAWQEVGETRQEKTDREGDAANPHGGERGLDSSSRSPLVALDGVTLS